MSDKKFDIVFTGVILDGFAIEQVQQKAAQLFKLDPQKAQQLFRDKAVTLKKNLDQAAANKYQKILQQIGMQIIVQDQADAVATQSPQDQAGSSSTHQNTPKPPASTSENWQLSEPGALLSDPKPEKIVAIPDADFSVAPQQGHLLRPDERTAEPPVDIDFSLLDGLSVDEVGAYLLKAAEKPAAPDVSIDTSHLSISDAQGYLLDDSEKHTVPPIEIDTSGISLESP